MRGDDSPIPRKITAEIAAIVQAYSQPEFQELLANFKKTVESNIANSTALKPHIHTIRSRLKDPGHLAGKLERRYRSKKAAKLDVSLKNLTTKVTDLVGVRILHLYTRQFRDIDTGLRAVFKEYKFKLVEKPFARTWDDEYSEYFRSAGLRVQKSPSMYTSVHYVIASASETQLTCEVQVRTLMEEVWGEVDHQINYPKAHPSNGIREQLRTLARATSAATRLVDCIFACEPELRQPGARRLTRG